MGTSLSSAALSGTAAQGRWRGCRGGVPDPSNESRGFFFSTGSPNGSGGVHFFCADSPKGFGGVRFF